MRLVKDAIGADALVQALAACRIATQRKAAAQAAAPPSLEVAEEKSEHTTAKADAAGQNPANLDVAQEAEDVLAIAGVNPEDEAKLMFGDQVERPKADVFFHPRDKDQWRKLIELRIFARICGDKGLASHQRDLSRERKGVRIHRGSFAGPPQGLHRQDR